MSKHTPGPWVIIPRGDEWSSGRIATIEPQPEDMVETNYWTVAEVNYRRDEHAANALLIAAAPELLDALKDAICALECCGLDYDHVLAKAKRAVEKAEKVTI